MQNQNRKTIVSLLVVQIAITLLYSFALIEVLLFSYNQEGWIGLQSNLLDYLPHLVVLICSLWPQAALIFKHKLHSQDGEIMPMLFTFSAMQASLIVVDAVEAMGYIFVYPEALLVIQRFSLLGTAALFLFVFPQILWFFFIEYRNVHLSFPCCFPTDFRHGAFFKLPWKNEHHDTRI